ncbi:MAG: hypothetical protein AB1646_03800 [Thermodesulfobacteriota bacterium]
MLPPEHFIALLNKTFPTLWRDIDACRSKNAKSWPKWCFIRRDELDDIMKSYVTTPPPNDDVRFRNQLRAQHAAVLAPWRVSKNVYRFDPDIYSALIQTSLRGSIPVELLFRLPEWAVYIETPGLDTYFGPSEGFVASLNYSPRTHGQVRLTLLSLEGDNFFLEWLPLKDGITIDQAMAYTLERRRADMARMHLSRPRREFNLEEVTSHVSKLLNLLLYICQVNSEYWDVRSADGSNRIPGNPVPTKTKKGLRHFPPDKPTVWECGMRQGSELRRAMSQQAEWKGGTHRSPIPHTRVAHWQTYMIGKGSRKDPTKGERVLKWIHTILVSAREGGPHVPVERKVGGPEPKRKQKKHRDEDS